MKIGTLGTIRDFAREGSANELQRLLSAGDALQAYPSRVGVFPFTPVEQLMQQVGHLEAGLAAQAAGCAAVAIDSLGDYGIAALKAALTIPVVGAGEAGMAEAGAGGRRFAIVTVWPSSLNYIPEALLRLYGWEDQCTEICNVGEEGNLDDLSGPDGYLTRVHDADKDIMAGILAAAHGAIARGAEAILLGCTCMSPLADKVITACDFPVINPLAAAVSQAAALAAEGAPSCARALRPGRPEMIVSMVDAVASGEREACPVCVIAEAS